MIVFLLVGAVVGGLAGLVMRGHGFGLLENIILGVLGALIGATVLTFTGIPTGAGLLSSAVTGFIGAAVLLFVVGLLK